MARRRSGKKIDFVHWTGFQDSILTRSAGISAKQLFPAQHDPETLMRMRGNLLVSLDATQAPGSLVQIAVGAILVPEGTGTTVLWSPATDPDAPWIWYEIFVVGYEEMVTDVVDVPGLSIFRSVIDNKAMRIIRNQEIQWSVENVTVAAAAAVNVTLSGRALFGT